MDLRQTQLALVGVEVIPVYEVWARFMGLRQTQLALGVRSGMVLRSAIGVHRYAIVSSFREIQFDRVII